MSAEMRLRLDNLVETAIRPALKLLPPHMTSYKALMMLLAIGLQESRFTYRRQLGDGPARGFWQFEEGTRASRGGVWGVYLHHHSVEPLRVLCHERDCAFEPRSIWAQLERDDVLAAGVARLMLWTVQDPLPQIGDVDGSWAYYMKSWRPGKPHPQTWPGLYAAAREVVEEAVL